MPNDDRKPVGDLIAVVENPQDRRKSDFVTIGALWLTERGHLMGKMNAQPTAWADPHASRQVMVRIREGFQLVRAAGSASSRSYLTGGASPRPSPAVPSANYEGPPDEDDIPFDPEPVPA